MFALSMTVELILLLILLFGIYFGAKRGLLRIAVRPVRFIASAIVAFSECDTVAMCFTAPLLRTPIADMTARHLGRTVSDMIGERIVYIASIVISFSVIYFITRALISAVFSCSDTLFLSGPLGCVNRATGAIVGFSISLIFAWLFAAAVNVAFATGAFDGFKEISDTPNGVLYRTLRGEGLIDYWHKIQLINFR